MAADQLIGGFDVAEWDGKKVAHDLVLDPEEGLFFRIVRKFGHGSGVFVNRAPLDQPAERVHEGAALGQGVVSQIYLGLCCPCDGRRRRPSTAAPAGGW